MRKAALTEQHDERKYQNGPERLRSPRSRPLFKTFLLSNGI